MHDDSRVVVGRSESREDLSAASRVLDDCWSSANPAVTRWAGFWQIYAYNIRYRGVIPLDGAQIEDGDDRWMVVVMLTLILTLMSLI